MSNVVPLNTTDENRAREEQATQYNASQLGYTSNIAKFNETGDGSLAMVAEPAGNGLIDIVTRFPWTLSNTRRNDIPYIYLVEHKVEGGSIQKQLNFYTSGIADAITDYGSSEGPEAARGLLDVYKEIFVPSPTKFRYKFPYFAKMAYEVNTTAWQQFDKISGSAISQTLGAAMDFASDVAKIAMKTAYPVIGVADRPRIFTSHTERSITIEFPLFNTINEGDWKKNKDFIQLFMGQNLFNKRNFITGLPPVWYKVQVPGQYYSVASCVTNFTAENLGNIRAMFADGKRFNVPDAYQIKITLQEMAMPSKNQFQASINASTADVDSRVSVSTSVADVAGNVVNAVGQTAVGGAVAFGRGAAAVGNALIGGS